MYGRGDMTVGQYFTASDMSCLMQSVITEHITHFHDPRNIHADFRKRNNKNAWTHLYFLCHFERPRARGVQVTPAGLIPLRCTITPYHITFRGCLRDRTSGCTAASFKSRLRGLRTRFRFTAQKDRRISRMPRQAGTCREAR
jgi:hypothetical protein